MPKLQVQGNVLTEHACKGHCYLYSPGTSKETTVTTTESLVHDGEATPRVEAKESGKDEGAGRIDSRKTRGINGRNRASNAFEVGAVDACSYRWQGPPS